MPLLERLCLFSCPSLANASPSAAASSSSSSPGSNGGSGGAAGGAPPPSRFAYAWGWFQRQPQQAGGGEQASQQQADAQPQAGADQQRKPAPQKQGGEVGDTQASLKQQQAKQQQQGAEDQQPVERPPPPPQQQEQQQQQQQQQQPEDQQQQQRSWWSYFPGCNSFSARALSPSDFVPWRQPPAATDGPAASDTSANPPRTAEEAAAAAAAAGAGAWGGAGPGGGAGSPTGFELVAAAKEAPAAPGAGQQDSALGLRRQAARLLSLLCLLPGPARDAAKGAWVDWLRTAAKSDDCRLSSYAMCALLHLEACLQQHPACKAAAGGAGGGAAALSALGAQATADLGALLEDLWPFSGGVGGIGAADTVGTSSSSCSSSSSGGAGSSNQAWKPPVSYADGVHLLVPSAPHHWAVLRHQPATLIDSLTAAASAALASATEDLGQSDFGGAAARLAGGGAPEGPYDVTGGDGDGWEVRKARSEHLANAVAGAAAGLRAAARALRGEEALQDAGIDDAPCFMNGGSSAAPGGAGPLSGGGMNGSAWIGPDPVSDPGASPNALPEYDVVFIHGVRGGPFVTWRRGDVMSMGSARQHLAHGDCWPAAWLAEDLPGARLLSIEYHVSWGSVDAWVLVWVRLMSEFGYVWYFEFRGSKTSPLVQQCNQPIRTPTGPCDRLGGREPVGA